MTASFSSKRLASGLSNTDGALASYDLRERILRPGAANGTTNETRYFSSPGGNG